MTLPVTPSNIEQILGRLYENFGIAAEGAQPQLDTASRVWDRL
jgi:hypothetical protein